MTKPDSCICENKRAVNRAADERLFRYFLNLKFQASSQRLWLHSPVCDGPGLNP